MSFSGTGLKGWVAAIAALALAVAVAPGLRAQTYTPRPLDPAFLGQTPYRYTGLLIARPSATQTGFSGSGAVVGHPRVVYSCAHLVYDEETAGWFSYVRWFRAWNSSNPPSESQGQLLRGYRFLQGYASAARDTSNVTAAYSQDFVVHYSYENTANGDFGQTAGSGGVDALKSSGWKFISGYPSGLYASGDARRYLMHHTGTFTRPFTALTDRFLAVEEVSTGPGNSGGPIWLQEGGNYYYIGTVLAGTARSQGGSTDVLGAYGLDSASRALIEEAIGGATPPAPEITLQPSSRRVYADSSVTFTAGGSGVGLRYQWYHNGKSLGGGNGTSYTIPFVAIGQAGLYHVVISNDGGQVTSQAVLLEVEPSLRIVRQPVAVVASPGTMATFTVVATGIDLTYTWYKNDTVALGTTTTPAYSVLMSSPAVEGSYSVVIADASGRTLRSAAASLMMMGERAEMAREPASQRQKAGSGVTFTVAARRLGATYQWYFNGMPIVGATGSSYVLTSVRPGDGGSYRVLVRDADGVGHPGWSETAQLTVESSRLVNISTRGHVPPGGVMVPGFVMRGGGGAKVVLARAVGPGLREYQISTPLENPSLSLVSQDLKTEMVANRNWSDSAALRGVTGRVGAFPLTGGSLDAAVTQKLPLNNAGYTVKVADEGATGGIALAEVYETDYDGTSQIINVSTLGFAGTGERVLIAGFVVQGNIPKPLLIRGVGPGLEPYGVGERLADPQIELVRQQDGKVIPIASNDNWGGTAELKAAFAKTGAFELTNNNSRDAALVATVEPGIYTVVVSGVSGATGNVLVEIYDLEF